MKLTLLLSGAMLAASAAPALAQDASAEATSFTGPRAELFGGWDRVGTRTRFDDGSVVSTDKAHKDGWTAGGLLGYDMPIGDRLILGAFGSYAISTAKQCDTVGSTIGCIKAGREIEGGGRIGTKFGNKALLYAKGAYVNGQIRSTVSSDTTYASGHTNRDGWRAGAGMEYALNPHTYLKVEYDYTRFKSFNADDLGLADTSLRFDRNQVLGGFGVRF